MSWSKRLPQLVVASLLAVVSLGAPAAGADGGDRGLARPLRLPSIDPGARCPRTSAAPAGEPSPAKRRALPLQTPVGTGPAYLLTVGGAPAGVMRVAERYRDPKGWVGQKSPWLIAPRYRGPVLIRGARIDAPGEMRFAWGYGQHLRSLRVASRKGVGTDGWRGVPSATLVRTPGCYAYQVDGTSFSRVVVIQVVMTAAG